MTTTRFAVCPVCRGTGYGDHLGDVTEMIREDPDFADDYRAGHYNTGCERCGGLRVVPACERCDAPVQEGTYYLELIAPGDPDDVIAGNVPFAVCYDHLNDEDRQHLGASWSLGHRLDLHLL
jgi:hypothetical protein